MKPKIDYHDLSAKMPHKLLDLSIPNLEERLANAKTFDNALQVADYLGVSHRVVFVNRVPGKRVRCMSNKEWAIRLIK